MVPRDIVSERKKAWKQAFSPFLARNRTSISRTAAFRTPVRNPIFGVSTRALTETLAASGEGGQMRVADGLTASALTARRADARRGW